MAGIDDLHLQLETDQTPTHTLKIFVLEALADADDLQSVDVVRAVRRMAETFGFFRVVPVPSPGGIDHPRWFRSPEMDLDYHIRVRTVPAPGGRAEFDSTVGELTEPRLEGGRPRWQAWVLDGLADGRVAVVLKLHHSMADGVAAANLLSEITGDDPWPAPGSDEGSHAGRVTVRQAISGRAVALRDLPGLLRDSRRAARSVRALALPRLRIPGPRNPLRGCVSPVRSFATASLSLAEIRAARSAVAGSTVNDVLLTLVGGALRDIMNGRGELPVESLLAVVPVSTDPPDGPPRTWGNGFSQLFTVLATDVDDPVERLGRIHAVTAGRKRAHHLFGDLATRWWEQIPPAVLHGAVRTAARLGLENRVPLPGVSVSNVRGPAERIALPHWGFEIAELYSVGPVLNGTGLNVTAWSYQGRVQVVALTDPTLLCDAHRVTEAMAGELRRLIAAQTQSAVSADAAVTESESGSC